MKSKNMHYCYNVEYFQDTLLIRDGEKASKRYEEHNRDIYKFTFQDGSYLSELLDEKERLKGLESFELETVYPGLFVGSGYMHEGKNPSVKDIKNVITGGFFFDYVTGLPVIPGSTLKGMLRSYFQAEVSKKEKEKADEKWELIKELAEEKGVNLSGIDRKKLEENLFEGEDVYIGAFPSIGKGKLLLDAEYITPHKEQFKDPTPIKLLKVRPGVKFQFVFLLHDYMENEKLLLSAQQKRDVYKELLKLNGIGAKTNVGFGQFQ